MILTPDDYVASLPAERQEAFQKLRSVLTHKLPDGFEEVIQYGMISYVVPHSLYPKGYHCNTQLPLPFISVASQKNFIALYHMGIYADKNMYDWFTDTYSKVSKQKLDMGKSCIRFKKMEQIPFELIGELAQRMSVDDWIKRYENSFLSANK